MANKVKITGTQPKRIRVIDKPQRRIEPAELAAALGAKPGAEHVGRNLDPISLAELGTELQRRLRSSGGRPALIDATEYCRVPLSAEDMKSLEKLAGQIEQSTGTKPSPGQLVSVIVREYLSAGHARPQAGGVQATIENEGREPKAAIASWLPRLADIANKVGTVQDSASDIATAVKQLEEQINKGIA